MSVATEVGPIRAARVSRSAGSGPAAVEAAARRIAALKQIDHPGICVPDGIEIADDGEVFVHSRRAMGGTLSGRRLPIHEAVGAGIDIAAALAALHAGGLVHGDVSAANIAIGRQGAILIDVLDSVDSGGTARYCSPQRGFGASREDDVYALARVLLEHVDESGAPDIQRLLADCLHEDPGERPTAAVVAERLASEDGHPVSDNPAAEAALRCHVTPERERTERDPAAVWWRRMRWAARIARWAAVVAVAVLAIVIVIRATQTVVPDPPYPYGFDPPLPIPADRIAASPEEAARTLIGTAHEGASITGVIVHSHVARRATVEVAFVDVGGDRRRVEADIVWDEKGWRIERERVL